MEISFRRFMLKATSSAVSSEPSWNFTPWRILTAIPILPSVHCQLSMTAAGTRLAVLQESPVEHRLVHRLPRAVARSAKFIHRSTVCGKAMSPPVLLGMRGDGPRPVARAAAPLAVRRNVRRVIRMCLPPLSLVRMGSEPQVESCRLEPPAARGTRARASSGARSSAPRSRPSRRWQPRRRSGSSPLRRDLRPERTSFVHRLDQRDQDLGHVRGREELVVQEPGFSTRPSRRWSSSVRQ